MKIDEIETEILCIILEHVCGGTGSSGASNALMLVNKYFHSCVQAICHRHHKFMLYGTVRRSLECQKKLLLPIVLRNLRHLTVESRGPWAEDWEYVDSAINYEQFLEQFEPFNDYIRSLSSLTSLVWNAGPCPETLLTTLKASHPRVKLKVLDFARFQPHFEHPDKAEIALSECALLTHIRFGVNKQVLWHRVDNDEESSIRYTQSARGGSISSSNLEIFLRIVSNAPKLKYAGFVSDSPFEVVFPDRLSCRKQHVSRTIRSLTLDGKLTLNKAMLVELGNYIDLGQMTTLKISRGRFENDFFQYAQSCFANLQHISLNLRALFYMDESLQSEFIASVKQFFLHCAPLETISIWSWHKAIDLVDILARHGKELRTLQLHERADRFNIYDNESTTPARVFSLEELQAIRKSCPNLIDLTVDLRSEKGIAITRPSAELSAKLDELASFETPPHILRLYAPEIGMEEDNVEIEAFVKTIWKRIYAKRMVGERRLEVKFGEWETRLWRNPYTDCRRFYLVKPHERDDMPGECVITYEKKKP